MGRTADAMAFFKDVFSMTYTASPWQVQLTNNFPVSDRFFAALHPIVRDLLTKSTWGPVRLLFPLVIVAYLSVIAVKQRHCSAV